MNKTLAVQKHLEEHVGITSMEAIELYGATRLSAIIFNLKEKGYRIITVDHIEKDRYGNTCRFAEYRMEK